MYVAGLSCLRNRSVPDVAYLTSAAIFVVGNAVRVGDALGGERTDRQDQGYRDQP
jgi:hypothetical protein